MSDKEEETPVETERCGGCGCGCSRSCSRTYKDGCLVSAQVLSIIAASVALILGIIISVWSVGYQQRGIIGLAILWSVALLVLFMLTCCCRRPRRFIIATGVLAVFVSLCVAGPEVYLVIRLNSLGFMWSDSGTLIVLLIGLISLLWLVAGILALRSQKYSSLSERTKAGQNNNSNNDEEQDIEAHAVEPHVIVEPDGTTPVELENEFDKDIEALDIEAHAVESDAVVEPNGTTPVENA
mmetsp:Transcript_5815/g.6541  ORF Transcript_5815/g.6541 Transcript_5815/m.6541 type:complete len:239 (+) Transcript_5815:83-799(+)